ncbi:putative cellulose synthase (UDP-forming) [Helianthus anomalus]
MFMAAHSVPEICYASLLAYCIITGSHFFPKINERPFLIFMGIFFIYNLYVFWEFRRIGLSLRMWWNLKRINRVNTMTAWLFGSISVIPKLMGLSKTTFEVTQKEYKSYDLDNNNESVGRFTYDKSPMIVPGVSLFY